MVYLLYKWLFISLLSFFSGFLGGNERSSGIMQSHNAVVYHPYYISVTEVLHNASTNELEITCKIFAEDFEQTLNKYFKTKIDLSGNELHPQMNPLVNEYISRHLQLAVDGKAVKLNFVGFEKQSESVYCYFEVPNIEAVKKINITDNLLHDFSDKQINIIHVTVNGKRQSLKLDYPQKQASFNF